MESFVSKSDAKDFSSPLYWKNFYEKTPEAFEWYGNYQQLSNIFDSYIKPKDCILQIGCGNSQLADELYDNGYRNILSIDTDSKIIDKQKNKNATKRPELVFKCCSANKMTDIADSTRDVIIDKGTLDAIMSNKDLEETKLADEIFEEVNRCLKVFGRYITITLAQENILCRITQHFLKSKQHHIRFRKCDSLDAEFCMPVFAIIITKLANPMTFHPSMEFERNYLDANSKGKKFIEKMESLDSLLILIKSEQEFNWLKHYVSRRVLTDEISLKIYSFNNLPKYELFVLDNESLQTNITFAVFIVPLDRNFHWLYCTRKGRRIVLKQTQKSRLIIVRMFKEQSYTGSVEEHLSEFAIALKPKNFHNSKIEFLSLGSTNPENVLANGTTKINGDWWVEESDVFNEKKYRKLFFKESAGMVQSEAEFQRIKGKWKLKSDLLVCGHHESMLLAFKMMTKYENNFNNRGNLNVAVLGLGGGLLPRFLYEKFPQIKLTVVEYDPEIVLIAKNYFGFPQENKRLRLEIDDAHNYLKKCSEYLESNKMHVLLVDLATNMNEVGVTAPPPTFLTDEALRTMRNSVQKNGIVALNFVTRDDEISEKVKTSIKVHFPHGIIIGSDEDVNEVLICFPADSKILSSMGIQNWQTFNFEQINSIL